MYNFILHIVIMSSLGVVVYLFGRAIPRASDVGGDSTESLQNKFDKFITRIPFDEIDIAFSTFIEKTLRKIKLLLMKWDNIVTSHIEKIKKTTNGGFGGEKKEEKQSLFISADNQEDKQEIKKEE